MKKTLALTLMVLIVLLMSQAALDKATAAEPKRGGILTGALHYDPPHWDVHKTTSYRTQVYGSLVYSKLMRDKQGPDVGVQDFQVVPDLAESWEQVSPTEVIFHLRKGVKWQNIPPVNGRELTSADIKYTFDRIFDPELKSPNRAYYAQIDRVETPDKYTVKFIMKEPFAPFVKYTALTYGMIVAKEVVEKYGDLKKWETAIGSGPWILKSYKPNEIIHVVRNPDYYEKGRPYLDEWKIRLIASIPVIVTAFRTKQIDMITGYIDYDQVREFLKKHPKEYDWVEHFSNSWMRFTLASDKPPFNDKRMRQAFSMTIDRKKNLIATYPEGRGRIESIVPISLWGSIPHDKLGKASKYFQRDVEEARRLVKAAGFKTPLPIKITYTTAYGAAWQNNVDALIAQVNSSKAFKVTLVPREYGAYVSGAFLGKYEEEGVLALTTPPSDADEILFDHFIPSSSRNAGRVNDPKLIKAVKAQRAETDPDKRLKILTDLQYYLAEQLYNVQTTAGPAYDVWPKWIKGYMRHNVPAYNIGDRFRLVWFDK
jgi:ABC-type transport system substrate-binding protein